MLHLPRVRRRVFGPGSSTRVLGFGQLLCRRLRCSHGLGVVGLSIALGCSREAPPRSADEPMLPSSDEAPTPAEAPSEISAAAPAEPAAGEAAASEPAPSSSPEGSPRAPRDTRGKQEIQQVMADNRDKVRACYDAALAKNPGIAGDLVIDFSIDPRGAVKQAEVNWSQSDIHVPELDVCATNAVRGLEFPASSRGLESKVSYPFNFNPPRPNPPGQSSQQK